MISQRVCRLATSCVWNQGRRYPQMAVLQVSMGMWVGCEAEGVAEFRQRCPEAYGESGNTLLRIDVQSLTDAL